jgi:AmmeMemoRadiSam system protein B/AmmeMemoRadiSam system protein A
MSFATKSRAQMESSKSLISRTPVASGRFYSAHADKLEVEIKNMIGEAKKLSSFKVDTTETILGLIAPHAGYVFSGTVAASAFLELEKLPPRKRIFLIGSSHHTDFNGASIYNVGDYITPFGNVKVDIPMANRIIKSSEHFNYVQAAHAHEHCLEVLLPFIQHFWNDSFEIIPIIIATHSPEICRNIALALLPYFSEENLFVISTDLSHYPEYKNAVEVDKLTIKAAITGDPEILLEQLETNKKEYIPNLSTSMCGWTSVLTLMYMSNLLENTKIHPILYQNSGDAKLYGDTDRVVGYQSMAVTQKRKSSPFSLNEDEKSMLIETALIAVNTYKKNKKRYHPNLDIVSDKLKIPAGAFVSVYLGNDLRGCIGRMHSQNSPLIQVVSESAVSAAFHDSRFAELTDDELEKISIEISVLTPLKKIDSLDAIVLGKHGIYIKKGFQTGTFLPQVADKTDWTVEEFVGHCAKNKAGIGWDGWKEAELYTYEAIIFRNTGTQGAIKD